jgi:hypothetical protein
MLLGKIDTFKCVGMWDAQYNVIKLYFFYPFMMSDTGFNYSEDYQITKLIENNTLYISSKKDDEINHDNNYSNKYIGLEDDGQIFDTKPVKHGNSNQSTLIKDGGYVERSSIYGNKYLPNIDESSYNDEDINKIYNNSYMSGGDNIPNCYAMTYIIKK